MIGSILNDLQIIELCQGDKPMIIPFEPKQCGKPSYGLGSFGYDLRLGTRFMVHRFGVNTLLDPKKFPTELFTVYETDSHFDIAPHANVLAESVETFDMPPDVTGIAFGKSTYARCGLLCNLTPVECFDDQTEVLTLVGWKKFEDLDPNEIVATLNEDGVLEYHPIVARQKRWYNGEMIAIRGRSIDLLVTPEHQLYVRRQNKFDFELLQAMDLEGCCELEFKRDSVWLGESPQNFTPSTWSRIQYNGYVYDVTVPPNHTIYVRRNGKAVWSGNCSWRGKLTLELANLSPLPIRLHVGQGIAQVMFFRGERPKRTYREKEAGGVYQDQTGVTLPQ